MSRMEILIVIGVLAVALVAWLASVTIDAWRGESGGARPGPPSGGSGLPARAPANPPAAAASAPLRGTSESVAAGIPATAIPGPAMAHLDLGRPGRALPHGPEPTLGRPPEFGGWVEPGPGMTVAQKSVLALVGAGVAYLVWLRLNR